MRQEENNKGLSAKLWGIAAFAMAMAYVESAAVIYLRRLVDTSGFRFNLSTHDPTITAVEIGRELATLIMLFTVGWLTGKQFQSRFGFFIFAFALWDIFYYIWLKVCVNWPASLIDMDLLFLVPLPWWGPVLSPVLIAILMAIVGARLVVLEDRGILIKIKFVEWSTAGLGILIMLYTFMADALALLSAGQQPLPKMEPSTFNWPVFLAGFALVAWGSWHAIKPKQ